MNLSHLTDEALMADTEQHVKEEREKLTTILYHLKEIERRRLFSKYKYGSLYQMAMKKFGYSEDQAYRRVAAMRLLRELPEIEEKISEGKLTLTNMGLAQSYFKRETKNNTPLPKSQKLELLSLLENTSKLDAERKILEVSGIKPLTQQDRIRPVSSQQIEIKFIADNRLQQKIQDLKGLLAHSNPNITLEELFDKLCDLGIEKFSKTAPARDSAHKEKNPLAKTMSYAETLRQVRHKAQGRCENCRSTYALEIDHRIPQALGGSSEKGNLRLLCRNCNQRAAIEVYGLGKMETYLSPTN